MRQSTLNRTLEIDLARADKAARTVPATISTTFPVNRGDYIEVLDHSPASVDLSRAPLPLIESHNSDTVNVGVVENLKLEGEKLRGLVRFGRSRRADELLADVTDGVVRNLSVGYQVHSWRDEGKRAVATRWQPHEVSVVSIPADPHSGFFRSKTMSDDTNTDTTETRAEFRGATHDAARRERYRCNEIGELAARHNLGAFGREHISAGTSLEQFRGLILDQLDQRGSSAPLHEMPTRLGLTENEIRQFSLSRLINSMCEPSNPQLAREAAFEREACSTAAKQLGRDAKGFQLPYEVQRGIFNLQKRTNTVGGSGGNVVQTSLLANEYVPVAYNTPVVVSAGARVLGGLRDTVKIPKMTSGSTASWVATENATLSTVDPVLTQVSLSPKDVGVYTDVSRRLLLQSNPAIDAIIRDDLAMQISVAIDQAAINGSGASGQPLGVMGQSGVGTAPVGTNGGPWTWSLVTTNVQNVMAANRGVGALGWIMSAQARMHGARTVRISGYPSFLIDGPDFDKLAGYPLFSSQNVPTTTTKGTGTNLTAAIFGSWSDVLIGEWGTMDILVDPYTFSNTGAIRIRVIMSVDVGVRYGASFSMTSDINPT